MAPADRIAPPSVPPSPCTGCGYDLAGLANRSGRVKCPECGLEQRIPAPLLDWPGGRTMAIRMCSPTLVLCNVCFVLLLINELVPPVLAAWAALVTMLSGPIVFLEMSRRRDRDEGAKFILLGWLWNLLIGAAYIGLASIWPYQWTLYDESAFW